MVGSSQAPTKKKTKMKKPKEPIKSEAPKQQPIKKPPYEYLLTEERKINISRPADYSFKNYTELHETGAEYASTQRQGKVARGEDGKLLCTSLWLNNNSINDIRNIEVMVNSVLEYPERLAFLDLSHNEIKEIDENLMKFKNLTVLYLHGNKIRELKEIYKLRTFKKLHGLTMYGNPIYEDSSLGNIRTVIGYVLPRVKKLDYNRLVGIEKTFPVAGKVSKFVEYKGNVPERKFKKVSKAQTVEHPKKVVDDVKVEKEVVDEKKVGPPPICVQRICCPPPDCSCS